jgi:hypothetical protein
MPRKNLREEKKKKNEFADVHNCEIEYFEDRDEDDDWLDNKD